MDKNYTSSINYQKHNFAHKILMEFYDYANELIDYIEEDSGDPIAYLELVENLVLMIQESVDIISSEHRSFIENGSKNSEMSKNIGNALRGIFVEVNSSRKKISTRRKLQNIFKFRRLSKTLDKIEKNIEKTHKEMSAILDVQIKDFRYYRSGRQEGQVLAKSKSSNNNSSDGNK